jgi:carboxypeptidase Q
MRTDGFDSVKLEPCMVPHWVRGDESLHLVEPRTTKLTILGIGNSIGTGPDGITAPVVVVRDYSHLDELATANAIAGRIVLFNAPFTTYGQVATYRTNGPSRAAAYGAVACLVRSLCPESLNTPHTGTLVYTDDTKQIPAACITIEHADMLARIASKQHTVSCKLYMEAKMHADVQSHNVVADLKGTEFPDQIIVLGGHSDSWDVGVGAHDDAQGCMVAWSAVRLIAQLGLRPKRTLRVVLWTNEENGQRGASAYHAEHKDELDNHVAAIESDLGAFRAIGFGFSGGSTARKWIKRFLSLLSASSGVDATSVKGDGRGVDISPLIDSGVPGLLLRLHDDWWYKSYFRYHHTEADTIDKVEPKWVLQNTAVIATISYLLADVPVRLPRN